MPQPFFHETPEKSFIELDSVDSTNNYALQQVHAGLARHGNGYFAHEQLAGKGQRGRTWLAARDSSIILSLVLDPHPLKLSQQFELSASVAVSVCRFLNELSSGSFRIKWPNDIYWHDRKAGGILIENIVGGETPEPPVDEKVSGKTDPTGMKWKWAVAGVGVNLNQQDFPENLNHAVSLRQVTGVKYDPLALAGRLQEIILMDFKAMRTAGFDPVYEEYVNLLYKKNESVRLKKDSRVFEATIDSVSRDGRLIVVHSIQEEFDFGQIEWLIPTAMQEK